MSVRRTTLVLARRIRHLAIPPTHHFIHIPKNGGNSVRRSLGFSISTTEPYHYRYRDVADQIGERFRFFCIVRNPWSRTVSRYWFAKQNALRWGADDPRSQYIHSVDFARFVRDQKIIDIPLHPGQPWMGPMSSWLNQLEWIVDDEGNPACDCLRLEHLNEDLSAYMSRQIKVKNRNLTKVRRDYREMYTEDLAETVATLFARDIEHFGFDFDSPATRNLAV